MDLSVDLGVGDLVETKTELKAVVGAGERHQQRLNEPFNIPDTNPSTAETNHQGLNKGGGGACQ